MPLTINLLHEEQFLLKQRQRDPLKLGLYALAGVAALFVLYYVVRATQSSAITSELKTRQAEWAKQQPAAKAAEAKEAEFASLVSGADLVSKRIEYRFYWAPLIGTLIRAVPPYVQIVNFSGSNDQRADKVSVTLEGVVGGDVPRLVADKFRGELNAALSKPYPGVETTFRSLEETTGTVNLNGKSTPTAHFTIEIKINKVLPKPAPARR